MPRRDLTFRIFVSSTFSDFLRERNALQQVVFPKLREYCRQSGAKLPGLEPRFQAIDLRWGVAREAALDQQTMKICIQELKRCQQLSPKPNFIVLMGDRYGWVPLPPQIEAEEFDELLQHMSAEQRQLVCGDEEVLTWQDGKENDRQGWYRKDGNAVPVEYVMQARAIDFAADIRTQDRRRIQREESTDWGRAEQQMAGALAAAIAKAEWAEDDPRRHKYERSATHQEIVHGALAADAADKHVFCYFRAIDGLPADATAKGFRDLNEGGSVDAVAADRLATLKRELEAAIPQGHRLTYTASWSTLADEHLTGVSGGASEPDLDLREFCNRVESDLKQIIDQELAAFQQESETEREARLHWEFTGQHTQFFVGREEMLERISDYCAGEEMRPLFISGESGSGKTALLSKATEQMKAGNPEAMLVRRFIGATPGSTELRTLLIGLCNELGQGELPPEVSELSREFEKRLEIAAGSRPVYVFLDALDQLSTAENSHALWWFPRKLPPGAKLIATILDREDESGECHRAAQRAFRDAVVSLSGMSESEGKELLNGWLSAIHRTLQPHQEQRIVTGFQSSPYPLYLRTAFDDARRWRSWETPQPLASNVADLLRDLFERLGQPQHHGAMMVRRSLGYLASARRGLAEDELLDVLSRDPDVLSEFRARSPDSPQTDRLPIVIWSRLFADLNENLTQRQAYGVPLLSFYHRQVREAVEAEMLDEEHEQLQAHQHLANYFREQDYWRESLEEQRARAKRLPPTPRPANIRKVDELPYHVLEVAKLAGKNNATSPHWDAVVDLLTDLQFLEAKAEAQPFVEAKEAQQEEAT